MFGAADFSLFQLTTCGDSPPSSPSAGEPPVADGLAVNVQ